LTLTPESKKALLLAAIDEKKATDVKVLSLEGKTLIADWFIVCTGNSRIHIRAIADGALEKMKEAGIKGIRCEGYEQGTWVLIDFDEVVVHIFDQEERERYSIEDLWEKMRQVEQPVEPVEV
jgi:ribosome-associated protein